MLSKKVILSVTIIFAGMVVISLIAQWGAAGLGLLSFLFGAINLLLALIFALIKKYQESKTLLLMGGVLFLIGFGLCSSSNISIH